MKLLNSGSLKSLFAMSVALCLPFSAAGQSTTDARQLDKAELRQITKELNAVSSELDALLAMSASDSTSSAAEVTVVKGDCLSALAKKHLGSASRWPELVKWNQDRYPSLLKNPDLIHIGWKLRMAPPSTAKPSGTSSQTSATGSSTPTAAAKPRLTPAAPTQPTGSSTSQSANSAVRYGSPLTSRAAPAGVPIIKSTSKVLHIGDSHTCGTYGKSIDALMRESGATVNTVGVSGSSPTWWFNGTVGKSGYYSKDEQERVDQPADWRTPRATPKLTDLIKEKKPDVLVVSLGANLIGGSNTAIQNQVRSICEIAKQNGTQLVWIGPPDGRESSKSTLAQARLYQNLKEIVGQYGGTFVDSRPFTEYPATGGDGVHYSGTEGTKIAREWAQSTYNVIQGK